MRRGWRLPGGGRCEREDPEHAVLRELREEIGMTSHGDVRLACELEEATDFKRDLASLLIVRDVLYTPRKWSWEVEAVTEASLDALPSRAFAASGRTGSRLLSHGFSAQISVSNRLTRLDCRLESTSVLRCPLQYWGQTMYGRPLAFAAVAAMFIASPLAAEPAPTAKPAPAKPAAERPAPTLIRCVRRSAR